MMAIPAKHVMRLLLAGMGLLAIALVAVPAFGAKVHPLAAATGAPGSLGASYFLSTNPAQSALQGEVATSANTGINIPFGVLGEYNPAPQPTGTFGIGVAGVSSQGYGVGAEALGYYPAMYARSDGSGDGIDIATAGKGYGASIFSSGNTGLIVEGQAGYGVFAETQEDGRAGVIGFGLYDSPTMGAGVVGEALGPHSSGLYGLGFTGIIGVGSQTAIDAELQNNSTSTTGAGNALDAYTQFSNGGEALLGGGTGEGVIALGSSGTALRPALVAESLKAGTDLIDGEETSGSTASTSFVVQGSSANRSGSVSTSTAQSDVQVQGDLYLTGNVYTRCSAFPATSTTTCGEGETPVPVAAGSRAFVEDAGEARLVAGSAHIQLDPAFASTISAHRPYMVFMTPNGESRGLYVIGKSRAGFDVRENAGGRSTMIFDYRILAYANEAPPLAITGVRELHNSAIRYRGRHADLRGAFPLPPAPKDRIQKLRPLLTPHLTR
jgi:hypothetical protein